MRTSTVTLLALSLALGVVTSVTQASAQEQSEQSEQKDKAGKTAATGKVQGEKKPLTAAEKAKQAAEEAEARAAEEALRQKVTANIESLVDGLKVGRIQKAKVKALTSETQWDLAVSAFSTSRGEEIHDHAHKIVPKTIPGLMQKFMPGYMRSKIMASRRAGRRGPPSRAEIAQIQKDARAKIEPQMRKTVMPALDGLTQERVTELQKDEKVMTRVLADRIIKVGALGKDGSKQFEAALDKAGYSAALTSGEDDVLNERTQKMLSELDLNTIVKAAGI
ncbi:MAG: hypothetical protein HQ518_18990 [Rhodopirellula sp.]|nr:hypothetical protein [Rhodopirellula sp.]